MSLMDKIKKENERKKSVLARWLVITPPESKKTEDILIFEEGRGSFDMDIEKKEPQSERDRYKNLIISFIDAGIYDEAIKVIEEMKEKGI